MPMIQIDGSFGEGGGQILRTALALSLVTGKDFRVFNIRKGRNKPGLASQHLTAVKAAVAVGSAQAVGAVLGSGELSFQPGHISAGSYQFAVGTAGSTMLVLQAILLPLIIAGSHSQVLLEGGTHALKAPPVDFVEKTLLPILARMGAKAGLRLDRYGFYPAGGGRVQAAVEPSAKLSPLCLLERGEIRSVGVRAVVSGLPLSIAKREIDTVRKTIVEATGDHIRIESVSNARGPGNFVEVEVQSDQITEVFSAFGRSGLPAEKVAAHAADQARRYIDSRAPVGVHLADQLLLPMAFSGGGEFVTVCLSDHTRTNMEIIKKFLDVSFDVTEIYPDSYRVRIES